MREGKVNWSLLSLLRFMLAGIVLFSHLEQFVSVRFPSLNAFAAVAAFLMISGFSIRHSLERKGSTLDFYNRRLHRIYPTYLFCLLLGITPFLMGHYIVNAPGGWWAEMPSVPNLIGHLFMVQGIIVNPFNSFGPAWSLSIECLFYLLSPLFLLAPRRLLWAGAAASCGLLALLKWHHGAYLLGPLCLVGFYWLGWLMREGIAPGIKSGLCYLLPIGAIAFAPTDASTLGPLTVAGVVLLMLNNQDVKIPTRVQPILLWLGDLSFPLYLCHVPVFWLLWVQFHVTNPAVYMAGAVAAAAFVLHAVDKPLRHPKSAAKVAPSTNTSVVATA